MELGRFIFESSPSYKRNISFLGNVDPVFTVSKSMVGMKESLKRRPFFSSSDEIYDDECFDDHMPEKKRRLTREQVDLLEKSFEAENKLEPERKNQLANKLGLQPRQVAIWFQNRRARWKTKQLERDYDILKSSYDSLLSDYDSVLKENEKLKSEVISLSEQLQLKEIIRAPTPAQKSDLLGTEEAHVSAPQFGVKVEDRLSSGTVGSAVTDEDGRQLVDSGESYFPGCDNYAEYVAPVDKIQVEDDRSDFPDVFTAAEQQHDNMGEPLGLWVWSFEGN